MCATWTYWPISKSAISWLENGHIHECAYIFRLELANFRGNLNSLRLKLNYLLHFKQVQLYLLKPANIYKLKTAEQSALYQYYLTPGNESRHPFQE